MKIHDEEELLEFDKKSLIGYSGYVWQEMQHDYHDKGVSLISSKHGKRLALAFLLCILCFTGAAQSAEAENVVASAVKASGGKWKTNGNGKRYYLKKKGKYVTDAWRKIDGEIYHFDEEGYAETGWIVYKSKKYYADVEGRLLIDSWMKKGKKYYYFLSNGTLARKKLIRTDKNYYYVNKNGVRVKNTWVSLKGKRYYFDWNGVRMKNGWVMSGGKLYYLGSSGAMATKQWVDGGKYYVGADGARMKDCVVDGYYLNSQGRKTVKAFKGDYIFVGDSRIVGMSMAISSKDTMYLAEVGRGYAWLAAVAGPELKQYLAANPDVAVVFALGVNDLVDVDKYCSYYKTLAARFPKTKFYAMSVNPVNEAMEAAHGYTVKNTQIEAFNKKLRAAVGKAKYINSYSYLRKKGFSTFDGLHYSANEYRNIYNFVIKKIKK